MIADAQKVAITALDKDYDLEREAGGSLPVRGNVADVTTDGTPVATRGITPGHIIPRCYWTPDQFGNASDPLQPLCDLAPLGRQLRMWFASDGGISYVQRPSM